MADRKMAVMKGDVREPLSPISAARASARTPARANAIPRKSQTPGSGIKKGSGKNENHAYDRFIPNRKMMDNEASNYMLMKDGVEEGDDFEDKMKENLNSNVNNIGQRILQMKIKAPENREGEVAEKILYTCNKPTPAKPKTTRFIPSTATKILDAPDITNDYYLNLLDWGSTSLIAIALGQSVYLWNAVTGSVVDLFSHMEDHSMDELTVTSVKWITDGDHIAIGLSNGMVQLWDASSLARVRSMGGHNCRVGSLAWNSHILTSGAKNGHIHNHDVRIAEHHASSFNSHSEEVCGMEWAPDMNYFASGANDNLLNIWDKRKINDGAQSPVVVDQPVITMSAHSSAVKAVAWCPWQRHLIASGGGIGDRQMRIWTTGRGVGTCLQSIDVMAQVSDILWSGTYREIVCSYGNNMGIWKYSTLNKEAELSGHNERILSMAMSPDTEHVASVGADETLRLWKCFEPPVAKTSKPTFKKDNIMTQSIR